MAGTDPASAPGDASPLTIVLVTTAPTAGGVWTHVADLHDRLRARGHRVVLALDASADEVTTLATRSGMVWTDAAAKLPAADVIHLHLHKSMDYGLMARQLWIRLRHRRTALVMTEHLARVPATDPTLAYDPTLPAGRRKPGARHVKAALKTIQLRSAHAVIAVSDSNARFLARRYRLARHRITAVHNGITAPDGWTPADPGRRLEVVAVGTLTWRKGFDVLIEAARLCTSPLHVTIYGTGPLAAALKDQAADAGLDIVFGGWTSDGPQLASAFDVLCLPSRSEALGYVALEAMAHGRAVVGSDVDGIPEVVEHGVTGLLVPPDSPQALADALDALAASREAVIDMGRNARNKVVTDFAVEHMVDRTERVYRRAARRAAP